ncbi:hypothetical protein [Nonomuraea gerenzanensis]|uniref:Uncharacterized protein n=1 Tax=Nonomuraea gerenzanensis TaxID=93944 RepID=A0A1M4EMV9_9ACTN|nr:hypothetical protein [Nonomuraea gerenzanensis]UBU11684.1 hypothetical protein LCN96_46500 [Nonomuraea gerenzanensis]SBP00182.1 hypothetical protein BN4615_P9698 [Nonomuraea gerenzanensis]
MAEFFEVRMTIGSHERAAELAHGILLAGLATSIDIAEAPDQPIHRDEPVWQLTLITTDEQVPSLEQHIRSNGDDAAVVWRPVVHDFDSLPDWLTDDQP